MNKRGNAKVSAGEFQRKKKRTEKEELSVRIVFHRFAPCKGIQDIHRFWIPDYEYLIPVFVSGTWILDCNP